MQNTIKSQQPASSTQHHSNYERINLRYKEGRRLLQKEAFSELDYSRDIRFFYVAGENH
jgi:hypothetical protein